MTPMSKWASNESFRLLAIPVLRIACEHDRMWSGLIKLRGNGGSGVSSHDVSVKVSDIQPNSSCEALLLIRTPRVAPDCFSAADDSGSWQQNCFRNSKQRNQLWVDATPRMGEQMDRFAVSCSHSNTYYLGRRHALWLSTVLLCCSLTTAAQKMTQPGDTIAPFSTRATHLLGFANAKNNSTGTLSIQDDSLQFQQNGKPGTKVKIASLRDVFLGAESKQVGGLPMTLGKTAAPFGGGRVVSLFAHKKYDTLTLEYADVDGGIHGAIFQLKKGQAEIVKNELMARGVAITSRQDQATKESAEEATHENK
jgi:hypothetical protein